MPCPQCGRPLSEDAEGAYCYHCDEYWDREQLEQLTPQGA